MFCRLMILSVHTVLPHECLMIYASSLLVLSCSRRFHLWISEIVFLSTITIANFISFWEWYCRHSFLLINFLLFWVSLLIVPSWCRWLHLVPESSSSFHVVPASSRWFQLLHRFSVFGAHHVLQILLSAVFWSVFSQTRIFHQLFPNLIFIK